MQDFDKVIRAAITDGNSIEDVASAINKVLNAIEKEEAEKRRKADAKERYLEDLEDKFYDRYNEFAEGEVPYLEHEDIADLATVFYAAKHPDKDANMLHVYHDTLEKNLITLEQLMHGEFKNLFSAFDKVFGSYSEEDAAKDGHSVSRDVVRTFLKNNGLM